MIAGLTFSVHTGHRGTTCEANRIPQPVRRPVWNHLRRVENIGDAE